MSAISHAAAHEGGKGSRVEAVAAPNLDSLWGFFGASNLDPISRIRNEAETGNEPARAALLQSLEHTLKAGTPLPRLELGRALHSVSRDKKDPAITLALVRLLRAEEPEDDPLTELTKATLAMALARTADPLGRRVLLARRDDPRLTHRDRILAEHALATIKRDSGVPLDQLIDSPRYPSRDDDEQKGALAKLALCSASLAEVQRAFDEGASWLAFRLTAEVRLLAPDLSKATLSPRLAGPLAWLESDSIMLRLSTIAGLGRRLQTIHPGLDRDRIGIALEERYRVEPSLHARRALVIALARGKSLDPVASATLLLASDLDPDPVVRRLADLARTSGELFRPTGPDVRAPGCAQSADRPIPPHASEVLKFAVDGTPCFTEAECRVLPFAAQAMPVPKP